MGSMPDEILLLPYDFRAGGTLCRSWPLANPCLGIGLFQKEHQQQMILVTSEKR